MHIFNNNLNDDWGFFVDIEPKPQLSNKVHKTSHTFKPRRIHSYKSVSNLDQLTNIYEPIFKMDEDYEEEYKNEIQKQHNNVSKNYQKFNFIGNICVVSSIVLFILLI
jgi:hypothetical protein